MMGPQKLLVPPQGRTPLVHPLSRPRGSGRADPRGPLLSPGFAGSPESSPLLLETGPEALQCPCLCTQLVASPLGLGSGRPLHPTTHSRGTDTQASAGGAWRAASSCVAPRGPCGRLPREDAHPGAEPLLTGRVYPSGEGLFSERQHQLRACSGARGGHSHLLMALLPPLLALQLFGGSWSPPLPAGR